MEILLVRHAQAGKADPKLWPDDDLRLVTAKGRKAFRKAAQGLKKLGCKPARILTSPALRTRETAELLARALGLPAQAVVEVGELHHEAKPARALAKLARMRLPASIALVGHEPWLGEFATLLIAGKAASGMEMGIEMDKGGAARIDAPRWAAGQGALRWLMTRDQLADF